MSWRRSSVQSTWSVAQQEETPPPTSQCPNNTVSNITQRRECWRHILHSATERGSEINSDALSCLSAVALLRESLHSILSPRLLAIQAVPAATEHRKTRSGSVSRNSSTSCIGTNQSPPPQCQRRQDVGRLLLWRRVEGLSGSVGPPSPLPPRP